LLLVALNLAVVLLLAAFADILFMELRKYGQHFFFNIIAMNVKFV